MTSVLVEGVVRPDAPYLLGHVATIVVTERPARQRSDRVGLIGEIVGVGHPGLAAQVAGIRIIFIFFQRVSPVRPAARRRVN